VNFQDLSNSLPSVSVSAVIQVAILYLVIYSILKASRGSRFGQALMGVGILAILLGAFTYLLHFDVLAKIVQFLVAYLAISSVVIFQPEIRRVLTAVGAIGFFERHAHNRDGSASVDLVLDAVFALAAKRLGALVAFERGISLRGYESSGVPLDAMISEGLLTSILTPPLPLHDGGIVVRDGRLASAHCIFPVSNNADLITSGMRHRAAVGLSEETDAIVVVVSEESGRVSIAHNGRLFRYDSGDRREAMRRWIAKAMNDRRRHRGLINNLADSLQKRLPKRRQEKGDSGVHA